MHYSYARLRRCILFTMSKRLGKWHCYVKRIMGRAGIGSEEAKAVTLQLVDGTTRYGFGKFTMF